MLFQNNKLTGSSGDSSRLYFNPISFNFGFNVSLSNMIFFNCIYCSYVYMYTKKHASDSVHTNPEMQINENSSQIIHTLSNGCIHIYNSHTSVTNNRFSVASSVVKKFANDSYPNLVPINVFHVI